MRLWVRACNCLHTWAWANKGDEFAFLLCMPIALPCPQPLRADAMLWALRVDACEPSCMPHAEPQSCTVPPKHLPTQLPTPPHTHTSAPTNSLCLSLSFSCARACSFFLSFTEDMFAASKDTWMYHVKTYTKKHTKASCICQCNVCFQCSGAQIICQDNNVYGYMYMNI